jgi:metal-responsive CopG/Arc/MetJ family transcriptional regulator
MIFGGRMAQRETSVKVVLNQQQLELIDTTISRVGAVNREGVVRIALREFFARHGAARPDEKA